MMTRKLLPVYQGSYLSLLLGMMVTPFVVNILLSTRFKGKLPSRSEVANNRETSGGKAYVCPINEKVTLHPFTSKDLEWANENGSNNKMFMLETSGSNIFTPKTACAIESANKKTELTIIVMVLSENLDLKDNTTCQLYHASIGRKLQFYKIDLEADFRDTPLYTLHQRGLFESSDNKIVHLSDALRIAYIAKFGGWYVDIDFIFLKSLVDKRNVVTLIAVNPVKAEVSNKGLHITTGAFNLDKGHKVLIQYMKNFKETFRGKERFEVGPLLFTSTIKEVCGVQGDDKLLLKLNVFSDSLRCHGLNALHPKWFYPFRPYQVEKLWSKIRDRPSSYWEKRIKNSFAVHFFGGCTREKIVSKNARRDLYSYLAPQYCPRTYHSSDQFV